MSYRYTKEHEWAKADAEGVLVGISDYAQKELGDVVYVELPKIGRTLAKGEGFSTVESVKAASEIYAPLSGTVLKINEKLAAKPELINSSPEHEAWIVLLQPAETKELESLMNAEQYAAFVREVAK